MRGKAKHQISNWKQYNQVLRPPSSEMHMCSILSRHQIL
ncbi:hypothetical protein BTN49_0327 (plasmid) [Candidatus Enterovibrio escicola]|uniref:Mobile element protein n=1 Tax=Candidatus Enterovibrio escicola TaxID=1927127 RepID=A0A2A5T725_9GAMM|nr:hypothetical protein BTN49_0327 [Candidatus Enterovibrio escacola]